MTNLGLSIWLSIALLLSTVSSSLVSESTITMSTSGNEDESSRETLKPWSDRWKDRRIGFHLEEVNPALVNHASALLDDETCSEVATKIFVPLCGKAVDMAYLATSLSTKTEILGLEGIRVALEEFIEEQPDLKISKEALPSTKDLPFERFVGENVSLWKGDYFDLATTATTQSAIGTFDAIYDRASIVAIEPELREQYVQILDHLLKPNGGRILLVALERVASPEHPSAAKKGPPYSIPEATIRKLFEGYQVEILQQTDQLVENPQDRERYAELDKLLETVYLIRKEGK